MNRAKADCIPLLPVEELARRRRRHESSVGDIWTLLDDVMDPEIPVISLYELGVLQDISRDGDTVKLVLTPTYIGCPALGIMEEDARAALTAGGYAQVTVETRLAPAWTTAWLTPEARRKMAEYGVASPEAGGTTCPQCGSANTEVISEFGSTACKSLFRCVACYEPFDVFKAL
ncbi:MAG: phenylacetate-CoA oxygenase subunit PaaJ [Luminiphilus sp.]|nr:phenylacetate-CoA oxygenase subunit PaaJ [Luminiphilus sp.]